jgi:flagellar motor protein MotB
MIGGRIIIKRGKKDEAEKPFWISFADLMTALMVLFLLVMSVALLAVTSKDEENKHEQDICTLIQQIDTIGADQGIHTDCKRRVIDFGDRARFDTGSYQLSNEQTQLLRAFVPKVLNVANNPMGQRLLKRIIVEGYTDQRGSYLYNLNLSSQRSQRVLCAFFEPPTTTETPLTIKDMEDIRRLFLVGGYSSNSIKATLEESRRIELRLEFFGLNEKPTTVKLPEGNFGKCAI